MPLQLATAVTTLNQGPLHLRTDTRADSMLYEARQKKLAYLLQSSLIYRVQKLDWLDSLAAHMIWHEVMYLQLLQMRLKEQKIG
jgi:hypothetical protein